MSEYGYGNTAELAPANEEQQYAAFKLDADKRVVASMQIKRNDGSTLFFPYSHAVLTEAKHQSDKHYVMTLLGGGEAAILHLKNFDDVTYNEFCDAFADHKIRYIFELPKNVEASDSPHFKVEVESLIRR